MEQLEIRLLGGFDVRRGGEILRGFESQKVRALLAYLACHPDRSLDRSHLAALLWPDVDPRSARQNLRQAAYNLRKSLESANGTGDGFLLTTHQSLRVSPDCSYFLDVEQFEQAVRLGLKSGIEADMTRLTEATELYRGHLLPAFSVKGSEDFDDWLWEKREQLRELAVRNLRVLIGCHLESGDYGLGIDHGRNLVEIDPLSEEAHRTLIHLYFLAGRRSQALVQYEAFAKKLETELDVKPLTETTALYESILRDAAPGPPTSRRPDPIGPFVTIAGRAGDLQFLLDEWQEVLEGQNRLVAIDGESGVGKTRLVKTFLHQATSETRCLVLRGRSYALSPHRVYGLLIDLLRNAWHVGRAADRHRFHQLPVRQLALIRQLLPELSELEILDSIDPLGEIEDKAELFDAVSDFLLCSAGHLGEDPNPLILFIGDAQWVDVATLELLAHLLETRANVPLLVVLTSRPQDVGPEQLDALLSLRQLPQARTRTVERIDAPSIETMVAALLEPEDQEELTRFLAERSRGLPLVVTELINYLCDFGHLAPSGEEGRWRLVRPLGAMGRDVPTSVGTLIEQRILRLPNSTRRLITLAALIGQRFDFHLLRRAADEHVLVVETAVGLMLEHWLARQFPDAWASTHRERDIVLWAQGARRGTFEFSHAEIRQSAYEIIPDDRRPLLHRQVAEAIEKTLDDAQDEHCEELAYHYLKAGALEEGAVHLHLAAQRATRLRADQAAHVYCVDAIDCAERLATTARTKTQRVTWQRFARRVHRLREQVADRLGPETLSRQPSVSITLE